MESAFRNTWTYLLLTFVVLALCAGAFAQGGAGELAGVVSDSTGAVVSGVQVKLTNSATGEVRTTVTTPAGIYSFPALQIVGTYALEIAAKGFKSTKVQNVIISVGTITSRDVKLEVGAATEQVTVEAGAQIVQTEESSLSQLVDRRVWEQMPLEARNSNDFVNLVAGAVPEQFDRTFRGASVNGTRTGTGNFMVEGVDNNEQGQGGVAICGSACGQGGSNTSISPDAIEEYRVITHQFNAEYGKAGGFVTDTVLKGGTNQWHGSLFEYNRIQALTAEDWFTNSGTDSLGNQLKDHLVRNQFGGSFGGPIVKDKTFFYATVEWQRLRESTPSTGTAFTQQFYDFVNTGAFETFMETDPHGFCMQNDGAPCVGAFGPVTTSAGLQTGSSTVGPIFKSQLARYPKAMPLVNSGIDCSTWDPTNAPHGCLGEGIYTGQALFGLASQIQYPVPLYDNATESAVTPTDQYRVSLKFDHKLSSNDQLNAVYLLEDVKASADFGGSDTTFGVPFSNPNRAQTLGITYTHTFSPTVLNQLKAGYVRRTANFGVPGTEGIPTMYTIDALVAGFGPSASLPQAFTDNEFQYKDDISVTKGKHSLKFGAEYRRTRNGSSFNAIQNGEFLSWGGEDLITDAQFSDQADLGYPYFGSWYYAGAAVNKATGQLPNFYRGYRANEVGMYAQDDWRIKPRLTLNLGLRWEYFGPPTNFRGNTDSNFYFGSPITPIPGTHSNPFFPTNIPLYASEASGAFQIRNTSIWNKDLNNFGPRIGFAWDTLGTQKFVVRGGFGIFYDRMYNNIYENIRFNPPLYCACTIGILQNGQTAGNIDTPGLMTVPFTGTSAFGTLNTKARPRHMDQNMVAPYYQQFNFGVEYAIAKDFALEVNGVGTLGRKLLGIMNLNTFDGRISGVGSSARPNPNIGSDNFRTPAFTSNYYGMNVTLRKRFSNGLQFNSNYTYAKALDELSDVFRAKGATSPTDPMNLHLDYGPSDFDVRHRFVTSLNYDLPFLKSSRFLGGWSVNGIFSWQTGASISLLDSIDSPNGTGNVNQRPNFVGTGSVKDSITSAEPPNGYINAADFATVTCPPTINGGVWCNSTLGRGSLHGPHFVNLDFGVDKAFKITERTKLTFQANFFDLANHPNFSNPNGNVVDPAFGRSQSTFGDTGGHRVTQLALRFDF
jgi:Carboxypeptidase regulatory-like domain/TonB dependent receptor